MEEKKTGDDLPITLQKIFNAAWQAFIVEDKPPALIENPTIPGCAYLTGDGRKCAVGLCIPDGHPAQHYLAGFGALVRDYPDLFDHSIKLMSDMELSQFQTTLHDALCITSGTAAASRAWAQPRFAREGVYRVVAKAYNLTIPE